MPQTSEFHIRHASSADDDAQFIVAAFDSTLPYLSSIGAGGMWGETPFSEKDGFEQETIESVQKSEHQDDCLKIFIAEVESSVTTAASVYAEQSERRTRVGLAMIRENSLPTYITEREEMKPEVDGAKRFVFLEVMISDYRTSPLHKGAGAALIEAIKRYGRENEKDTLYVDCWAGNDAKLNRSGFSVEQTGVQLIVATEARKNASGHLTKHTVSVVEELSQISYMAALQSLTPVDPSTAAYLVFTSGSTGCPKGILIEHASFCSALHHQLHHFDVRRDSRVFGFASYSFDISLHNMLATLSAGACFCVPSESDRVGNTTGVMTSMRATVVSLTTSVARLVEPAQVPTLQTLILTGEAVFSKDVDKWWGRVHVINAYGPAECTPISTINSTATDAFTGARIGTGKGSVTWVVDPEDHIRLLPPGVVGELFLEGPCLARCYLENGKKTSEAFIQDEPWLHAGMSTQPGRRGRLHKTGDLVCYHENGSLTYMGRKETQIKIHGQRVEIGEVEHHVRQLLPGNLDLQVAVDLADPQKRNDATLVVFAGLGGLTKRELTGDDAQSHRVVSALMKVAEQLREIPPSHMVPTSYKL